jgi:CheY-like chemotaxis protein
VYRVDASNLGHSLALATLSGRWTNRPELFHETARPYGVLVVDDEACLRAFLNLSMRRLGYATWVAGSGQEAFDVYQRHRQEIDVVLMDVRMPGLDGPQTLLSLQALNPHVECCFMSGDLGDYTEQRLYELGAVAVFRKPFQLGVVVQALKALHVTAASLERKCTNSERLSPTGVRQGEPPNEEID